MSDIITVITIKNMAREMVKRATAKNAAWSTSKDDFGRTVFSLADFKITKEPIRNPSDRKYGLPFTVSKAGRIITGFKTEAEAKAFVENEIKRGL